MFACYKPPHIVLLQLQQAVNGSINKGFTTSNEPQLVHMKDIPEVKVKEELPACKNHQLTEVELCTDQCAIVDTTTNKSVLQSKNL